MIVEYDDTSSVGQQGYGTVHHVAFRVDDKEDLLDWNTHLRSFNLGTSGHVERFYFESLYAGVAPGILFEWATDGPGFMEDEPYERLGEKLSLPPFFEDERKKIERLVRPIDTVRSTLDIEKEYL